MKKIKGSLEAISGAVINGSETERWFLDTETGQLLLISATYQNEEHIEKSIEMIKAGGERYLSIPYLSEDEFYYEVEMFARMQSGDNPYLEDYLMKAVKNKSSREEIKNILNKEPGKGKEFGDFIHQRVMERMQGWVESLGYELTD